MLTFRDMTLDDRDTVLPMVDAFYRSNAVDHPVPPGDRGAVLSGCCRE